MTNDDWARPTPEQLSHAKQTALAALEPEAAAPLLRRYYSASSDYAGASFTGLGANDDAAIGADDLFATTLLSVRIPARAARLLTEDGETRDAVNEAMAHLPTGPLQDVDGDGLRSMEDFYRVVKGALAKADAANPNPWVVASKLCARKRPDLFPVRDNVVCSMLGLLPKGNYHVDWQVFRHLMADDDVRAAIDELRDTVQSDGGDIELDKEPLRLLDAALWSSVQMA